MALDELIAAIGRDAADEVRLEWERAEEEAATIRAESDERLRRRREDALVGRERELRAETEVQLAVERRAARRDVLFVRAELLERVFEAVRRRLPDVLTEDRYREKVVEELEEAVSYLGGRTALLRCHPALVPMLEATARAAGLQIEADPDVGSGFILVSSDGGLEIDATLERRLVESRPTLALQVVRDVESGSSAPLAAHGGSMS